MRFRKSIRLAPGIRMNLSGSGFSWTLGPRGASIGIGKRGTYLNTGIPGTGFYSREQVAPASGGESRRTPSPGTTTFTATVSISDDGLLTFKDESGSPLPEARVDLLKKQKGDVIRNLIQGKCNEINGQIEALGELHHYTPDPTVPPLYESHSYDVQKPSPPVPKKPGFLAWFFSSIVRKVEAANAVAQKDYEERLAAWDAAKAQFEADEVARKKLFADVLAGVVPAMEQFFGEVLQDIVWPRETMVSFEVTEEANQIWLSVDLPEIEDMPSKTASVPQRGYRLSVKEMGPTARQKLYMRHIHAIGFRLIGEAFAMLPTVPDIVLSAYSQRPGSSTGQVGDEYLYSVRVHRQDWEAINFGNLAAVDVVEAFSRFELRRTMSKTGVFKPVEPFER